MLHINNDSRHKSFAYRFIKSPQSPPAQIYSLGWQIQTSSVYDFDGMNRYSENGNCIFQYTLSGYGILELNGQKHILDEGSAFITVIPSKHRYYIPKDSDKWEFLFITLTGDYALSEWNKIQEQFEPVIKFKGQEEIIKYLWETYWSAANNKITDGYQTSFIAYEFIMKLYRSLNSQLINLSPVNSNIDKSIQYMKENFHHILSLDEISNFLGMSKYHFNHIFTKSVGISPWNYLTKLRIEYAAELLLSTNLTIDAIANMAGYESSNYFNKVFRKYIGTSPGKFRILYHDIEDFKLNL
ncbi:helix-turn-helix domain-containing protein [Anaerocolumna sedimenticola]|uniref:Helix-turn-helix domain-containing protein n=1 Tax=Anaerocolumna sedimenticola TaxID=2696063 RepID=A0A6P1TKW7_9FIRM|nr:AraC family transcriptional regulator [Anaerocolumna sedimenticola]QHQ60752.1 helix-turn-helix domain-containing protein [Anaerocolumna sedimenticola]